jgi:NMD protein affecting ribosome stability and mRNA decay
MFCPECGSKLQNGYCPKCHVTYHLGGTGDKSNSAVRKCPKCNVGEMVLIGEKSVGLLLPPVGIKSKMYRCSSCGYEISDKNWDSMLRDEDLEEIKDKLKIEQMRKKIKDFVNDRL